MSYRCTLLPTCNARFSNYLDWCTHEIMMHTNELAMWICHDTPLGQSDTACDLAFRRYFDFQIHRATDHDHSLPTSYHYALGPLKGPFYCGFCRCVVENTVVKGDTSEKTWMTARLKHITEHMDAGCETEDWEHPQMY